MQTITDSISPGPQALAGKGTETVVRLGGRVVALLRPTGYVPVPRPVPLAPAAPVRLSRFAIVAARQGWLVAQAPGAEAEVVLASEASGLLGCLASWTTPAGITAAGIPSKAAAAILPLFAAAGLLAPGSPDGDVEDETMARAQWTVPDLWLHARSRGPRLSTRYGGVYPMAGRFPPLPAGAAAEPGPVVRLPVPGPAAADLTLTEAIERRRSVRVHDDGAPLTAGQLGELLYRTARVRRTFITPNGMEAADRPYPAGGATHELEIYPLVTRCAGLAPGLWHYLADRHELRLASPVSPVVRRMVAEARSCCLMTSDPQVVLVIAARFGRVMWKYDEISYSLILKHVGVYMQTVYLVATAMGLAVCAAGGGDAADFAAATGLDYFAQGSVGEMTLGSRSNSSGYQ